MVAEGTFPKPQKLGRSSLWREAEVDAWIDAVGS
jgi:predicted DNA-binding transcriptional regulator AlpA